jgi:hypothetical protein
MVSLNWPPFDPTYGLTGAEDLEWFTRLKERNARFAWSSDAITYEHIPADRMRRTWILKRSYRYGVDDIRIAKAYESRLSVARKTIEAGVLLATLPFSAFACLVPRWRLRMMRRWARGLGRMAAMFGHRYREYAIDLRTERLPD